MHPQQRTILWLNLLGGSAVLGSYAYGLATHPNTSGALWGGVPVALQPFYTISMLLAAAGYFPFTIFLVFLVDPARTKLRGGFNFSLFILLYALILIPSALWLPLTFMLIESWSTPLWVLIRVVLGLVAIGSLGMLAGLVALAPAEPKLLHCLAIGGAVAFCVQTALLDATVWPAYFPTGGSAGGKPCKNRTCASPLPLRLWKAGETQGRQRLRYLPESS